MALWTAGAVGCLAAASVTSMLTLEHVDSGSLPASNLAASTDGTTCNIQVSAIQLFYWPTPAPLPNITTIVGPDGFT